MAACWIPGADTLSFLCLVIVLSTDLQTRTSVAASARDRRRQRRCCGRIEGEGRATVAGLLLSETQTSACLPAGCRIAGAEAQKGSYQPSR